MQVADTEQIGLGDHNFCRDLRSQTRTVSLARIVGCFTEHLQKIEGIAWEFESKFKHYIVLFISLVIAHTANMAKLLIFPSIFNSRIAFF